MPVISSWKYTGACANPNGNLMYSYFLKGELKAVFGIEGLSNGMWWEPAQRSNVVKKVAPFNLEKMSSTLGTGQVNFLVTLLRAL